jgi:superfamily II DNA or RNA helicase
LVASLNKKNALPDDIAETNLLADLNFRYPLRKYQTEILDLVNAKVERGERQIHIVAPPGSGKTIIGLQLISTFKCPSLILCPNTTIQSQWGQKVDLFLPPDAEPFGTAELIGTHEDKPLKPITLLTYQVLSTPGHEQEYLNKLAHQSWIDELTKGRSMTVGEAEIRLLELLQNNPKAHQQELSRHASRLRKRLTEVMDLNDVLHENAIALLQSLRRQKFKLVIFDECHHLTDYWAAIMTNLVNYLGDPLIIGLTGTPPEGKSATQETRYLSLVGDIDYQVPTPALVKEGGLAPFQDLVYFTEPTAKELKFLEEQHEEFHILIEDLSEIQGSIASTTVDGATEKPVTPLTQWVLERVEAANVKPELIVAEQKTKYEPKVKKVDEKTHRIRFNKNDLKKQQPEKATVAISGWKHFADNKPALALALCRYMWKMQIAFPREIDVTEAIRQAPVLEDWMIILEDYASHKLKLSASKSDHKTYERIKSAARKLGYGITEQGLRKQASPVDRVLAFSNSKAQAVAKILDIEHRNLQDRLRAVVVTDFERMSATAVKSLKGVLSEESGGAIDALKTLLAAPISAELNPCLVTGSLLLTDKRITEQFVAAANEYIESEGVKLKLIVKNEENLAFSEITASGGSWESRFYVGMATAIFERGITKCLIGTRGLFGEGWDSQALNTMIDLTMTTSPVSVKQLRGRSIRIQTNEPAGARKCANNWDVVCIAPDLEKGLNDYHRFVRKHDGYYGIADDGQIECGVGHVHASLSNLTPVEVFASIEDFNQEMTDRALVRDQIYDLWKVGQPYKNRSLGCIEVGKLRKLALTPPHIHKNMQYKEHAMELRAHLRGVWGEYSILGAGSSLVCLGALHLPLLVAMAPFVIAIALATKKYQSLFTKLRVEVCKPNTQESSLTDIATAVLTALQRRRFLPKQITRDSIKVTIRSDGTYRVFLDDVEPVQSAHFINSVKEALTPVTNQPYLIPKHEYFVGELGEEIKGEEKEKRFFRSYLAGKAEPRIAAYYPVPGLLARSEKGREAYEAAWNKYVSPGFIVATETKPELLNRYFGIGPSLAQRLLWE